MTNLFEIQENEKNSLRRLNKVKIQNFRNIEYKEYNLNGNGLLLTGENGLGKTNVIEAIFWALSGYLFDGTAKTDSQGIIPNNAEKDTTTSVSLEFEYNLFTFEKQVEQKWSRDGETYRGTETKLFVNGAVSKDQNTALNALQNYLGFEKVSNDFSSIPELSKLNLFQLIYNANSLKTLDYKIIRKIIINMVGEVDYKEIINENQDKYGMLVESLKNHGLDLGALKTKTKKNISDKRDGLETRVDRLKETIKEYEKDSNKIVSKDEVIEAKEKIEKIDKEIETLKKSKTSTNDEKIRDINSKITEFENKIYKRETELRNKHQKKLNEIEKNSSNKELETKQKSLNDKNEERNNLSNLISTKELARDRVQFTLDSKKKELEREEETFSELKQKRSEIVAITDKFKDSENICPTCGTEFDLDDINEKGKNQKRKIEGLKEGIESLEDDILAMNNAILDLQKERNQLDKNIGSIKKEIKDLEAKVESETTKMPILDIENDKDILEYKGEIKTLNDKAKSLLNDVSEENDSIEEDIEKLKESKKPYETIINSEITARSYQENAKEKRKELKKLQDNLMKETEIITLIKELEKDMYSKLDEKIGNAFGNNVQFKLWKLNVSNGEYDTRMCDIYVKDKWGNFVDVKRINTGMFPIRACEIISKIKEHYEIPKSFIFVDEMSNLDDKHIELLKEFDEQILGTAKSNVNKIEERKF